MQTILNEEESTTPAQNLLSTPPTMITVAVNIPLLEKLDFTGGNLTVKWQRFNRGWSYYEIAAQLKDSENLNRNKKWRTVTLLISTSPDALNVINGMPFDTEDQRKDSEIILAKMEKILHWGMQRDL